MKRTIGAIIIGVAIASIPHLYEIWQVCQGAWGIVVFGSGPA